MLGAAPPDCLVLWDVCMARVGWPRHNWGIDRVRVQVEHLHCIRLVASSSRFLYLGGAIVVVLVLLNLKCR